MSRGLDLLLSRYERGHISRRELLGALTVLVAAPLERDAFAERAAPGERAGAAPERETSAERPALMSEREASAERLAERVGPVRQMNHVSIFVPDVQKSKQFYQDTFGLPLLTNQDPGVNLSTGAGFLGIYPLPANAAGAKAQINHLCLGIENFDADKVLKTLQDGGIQARIRQRGDTKELYLTDPDGISVQLQDTKYVGGTGPLGDRKPG